MSKDYLPVYRFGQGNAAALDVLQQRQSLAGLESRRPGAQTAKTLASHRLAVLLGKCRAHRYPLETPSSESGTSQYRIARRSVESPTRPEGELRVMASDHRVGAALANQLPGLRRAMSAPVHQRWMNSSRTLCGASCQCRSHHLGRGTSGSRSGPLQSGC